MIARAYKPRPRWRELVSMKLKDKFSLMGVMMAIYLFSCSFDFLEIVSGVSLSRLVGMAAIVVALLNIKRLAIPIDVATGALYGLTFVGLLASQFVVQSPGNVTTFSSIVFVVVIAFVFRGFSYTDDDLSLCYGALVASGLVLCVLMFTSSSSISSGASDRVVVTLGGSQQDANEFCGYFIFAAAFFAFLVFQKGNLICLGVLGIVLYVVLLTGSRGGLLAVAAAVAATAVFCLRKSRHRTLYSVMVIAVIALSIACFDQMLSLLPDSVSSRYTEDALSSETGTARTRAWADVVSAFFESNPVNQLVGHGFGATKDVTFNGLVAHNSYLELLYNCGILGLLSYLAIILHTFVRSMRNGNYVIAAAILGYAVLLASLSAFASKPFWGIIVLALVVDAKATCKEAPSCCSPGGTFERPACGNPAMVYGTGPDTLGSKAKSLGRRARCDKGVQ